MDFFINKNATLPILKMELIQDGRYDYKEFHELIQNSNIYFSMTNIENGKQHICKREAGCMLRPSETSNKEEYYITYQFTERETKKSGTYKGEFEIEFLDGYGTLIVPIKNKLLIHIIEGSIKN